MRLNHKVQFRENKYSPGFTHKYLGKTAVIHLAITINILAKQSPLDEGERNVIHLVPDLADRDS